MRIIDRLLAPEPSFSFEFFPPKTPRGVDSLFETMRELRPLQPGFVSVTYPGSATATPDQETESRRALTLDLTRRIRAETGVEAMAHLTCSAQTGDQLAAILDRLAAEGADNVLALRGDPPGTGGFVPAPGGFSNAIELVRLVRERAPRFCVGAACYPETHVECPDPALDIERLKKKVDAGVDFLVSQLFFDNRCWVDFMERVRAAGIEVPVVPGLMPVTSREGVLRMTTLSGATIPDDLGRRLEKHADDEEAILQVGIEHTTAQALELLAMGVPGIHFFTLNRSRATVEIVARVRAA